MTTDSEAIRIHQEEVRRVLTDELAGLIQDAIDAGVEPAQIRADIDAAISVSEAAEAEPTEPDTCPGCGFNEDHDEGECPKLTADQMRKAVGIVLGKDNEFWSDSDTSNVNVKSDGTWISPGTFGCTYGYLHRSNTIGLDGVYVGVNVNGEPGDPLFYAVVRVA